MALLTIPDEKRSIREAAEITPYLANLGIDYERWETRTSIAPTASAEEILAAYAPQIEELKARGGYVTADVIDVYPQTPGLDAMLARFSTEHWHDEDEIRIIVAGRGIYHVHPKQGQVIALEVEAGDLIRLPLGIHHWFDLCSDRRIRAIRLFQDPTGWTPHYTNSGLDRGYEPVCFGPAFIPAPPTVS
jgi:1,2-dihydroxy-3-keto-5-methylthiopentene dioxygenase